MAVATGVMQANVSGGRMSHDESATISPGCRAQDGIGNVHSNQAKARCPILSVINAMHARLRRMREHRQLLPLDEHALHDIGLTVDDVPGITDMKNLEHREHARHPNGPLHGPGRLEGRCRQATGR